MSGPYRPGRPGASRPKPTVPLSLPVRPLCGPRSCDHAKTHPPSNSNPLHWSALRIAQGWHCPTDTVIFRPDGGRPSKCQPNPEEVARRIKNGCSASPKEPG